MNRRQIYGRYYSQWPHLSSLYNSNRELEEDGAYAEHMVGFDNVFESPDEPNGAYKFYMAPREEFVLQSEPQVYSSSGGSLYDKSEEMGVSNSTTSSEYRGSTCKVLVCVFLTFGLIAVIAAAVTLSVILSQDIRHRPSIIESNVTDNGTVPVVESTLKMTNRTFTPELKDKNSTEFKEMESDFCKAIEEMYTRDDSPLKDLFESCEVIEFSPGSVVVKFRINLKPGALSSISSLPESMRTFFLTMLGITGSWNEFMVEESSVQDFNLVQSPSATTVTSQTTQTSKTEESSSSLSLLTSTESIIMSEISTTQELSESVQVTVTDSEIVTDESTSSYYSLLDFSANSLTLFSLHDQSLISKSQQIADSSLISSTDRSVSILSESISLGVETSGMVDLSSTDQTSIEPSRVSAPDASDVSTEIGSSKFSMQSQTSETVLTSPISSSVSSKVSSVELKTLELSSMREFSTDVIDSLNTLSVQSSVQQDESKILLSSSIPSYESSASIFDSFSDTRKQSPISSMVMESLSPSESLKLSLVTSLISSYSHDVSDSLQSISEISHLSSDQSLLLSMSTSESVEETSRSTFTKEILSSLVDTSKDSVNSVDFSSISSSLTFTSVLSETSSVPSSESLSFYDTETRTKTRSEQQTQQSTLSTIPTSSYSDEVSTISVKSFYIDSALFTDYVTSSSKLKHSPLSSGQTSILNTSILSSMSSQLSQTNTFSTASTYLPSTSISSLKETSRYGETSMIHTSISSSFSASVVENGSLSSDLTPGLSLFSSTLLPTAHLSDTRFLSSTSIKSDISGSVITLDMSPSMSSSERITSTISTSYSSLPISSIQSSDSYDISSTNVLETVIDSSLTSSLTRSSSFSDLIGSSDKEQESTIISSSQFSEVKVRTMDTFSDILSSTESQSLQTVTSEKPFSSVSTFASTSFSDEVMTASKLTSYIVIDSTASVYSQILTDQISDSSLDSTFSKYTRLDPSLTEISKDLTMTTSTYSASGSLTLQSLFSQETASTSQDIKSSISISETFETSSLTSSIQTVDSKSVQQSVSLTETSKSTLEQIYDSGPVQSYSIYSDSRSASVSSGHISTSVMGDASPFTSATYSDITSRSDYSDMSSRSDVSLSSAVSTDIRSIISSSAESTGSFVVSSSKTDISSATSYLSYSQSDAVSINFEPSSTDIAKSKLQTETSLFESNLMSEISLSPSDITSTSATQQTSSSLSSLISIKDSLIQSSFSEIFPPSDSKHSDLKTSMLLETNTFSTSLSTSYVSQNGDQPTPYISDNSIHGSIEPTSKLVIISEDQTSTSLMIAASTIQSSVKVSETYHPLSLDSNSIRAPFTHTPLSDTKSSLFTESELSSSKIITSDLWSSNSSSIASTFATEQAIVSFSLSESSVETSFDSSISIDKHSDFISTEPFTKIISLTSEPANSTLGRSGTIIVSESSLFEGLQPTTIFRSNGMDQIFPSTISDASTVTLIQSESASALVTAMSDHIKVVNSSSIKDSSMDVVSQRTPLPGSISEYFDSTLLSSLQTETSLFDSKSTKIDVSIESVQSLQQSVSMLETSATETYHYSEQSTYSNIKPSSSLDPTLNAHEASSDRRDSFISSVDSSSKIAMTLSDSQISNTELFMSQSLYSDSSNVGLASNLFSSSLIESSESPYSSKQYTSTESGVFVSMSKTALSDTLQFSTTGSSIPNFINKSSEIETSSRDTTSISSFIDTLKLQTDSQGTASLLNTYLVTMSSDTLTHSIKKSSLLSHSQVSFTDETSTSDSYSDISGVFDSYSVQSELKSFSAHGTSLGSFESSTTKHFFSSSIVVTSELQSDALNRIGDRSGMSLSSGIASFLSNIVVPSDVSSTSSLTGYLSDINSSSTQSLYSSIVESPIMSTLDSNATTAMDTFSSSYLNTQLLSDYLSITENKSISDVPNDIPTSNTVIYLSTLSSLELESSVLTSEVLPSLEINVTSGVVVSSIRNSVQSEVMSSTEASPNFHTSPTVSTASVYDSIASTYLSGENQTKFDNSMLMNTSLISPTTASSLLVMSNEGNMTEAISDMTTVQNSDFSHSETRYRYETDSQVLSTADSIYNVTKSEEMAETINVSHRSLLPSEVSSYNTVLYSSTVNEFLPSGESSSSISNDNILSSDNNRIAINQTDKYQNDSFITETVIESSTDILPSHALTLNGTTLTESASLNDTAQLHWTIEISHHSTSLNTLEGSEYSDEHVSPSSVSTLKLETTPAMNESVIPLINSSYNETDMTLTQNESESSQEVSQNMTDTGFYSYNHSMSLIEIDIFHSLIHNDSNILNVTSVRDTVIESDIIQSFYTSHFYNSFIETSTLNAYSINPSNSISSYSVSSSVRLNK